MAKYKTENPIIPIDKCPRCDKSHSHIVTKKLSKPMSKDNTSTHWAVCPNSGDPIFLELEEKG